MTDFASMGKAELRAACKAASISYSKLDNAGMRAALQAAAEFESPARVERPTQDENYVELAKKMDTSKLDQNGVEGHCPCCGINLDNGVAHYADIVDSNPKEARKMVREWTCLGCNGEWGEKLDHKPVQQHKGGTGVKIEKNREERNGVKRPSAGGKCRAVWDALDDHMKSGVEPKAADVREIATARGWNPNNAMIEFYAWRKFNGLSKGK